ncbi:MAG TPA: hypothetical protein VJ826_13975 [Candidatus Polarisedimenticolaceae bacterium]|nr:hypothetical protein [Candidatus Polarisedimenticolaceae bacterium]
MATVLLALLLNPVGAITVSPAPEKKFAAQSWVGFSSDDEYNIRLLLAMDGTGSGVILSDRNSPEPFEVTAWQLDYWDIQFSVNFLGPALKGAKLSGEFKSYVQSYTTTGPDDGKMMNAPPSALPGPLELDLTIGARRIRFGTWPEAELTKRLESLRKAGRPPSRHP